MYPKKIPTASDQYKPNQLCNQWLQTHQLHMVKVTTRLIDSALIVTCIKTNSNKTHIIRFPTSPHSSRYQEIIIQEAWLLGYFLAELNHLPQNVSRTALGGKLHQSMTTGQVIGNV